MGVVSTPSGLPAWVPQRAPCDIVEVRLDLLLKQGVALSDATKILANRRQPVLLTLRAKDEGGACEESDQRRAEILEPLLRFIDALDLEARHLRAFTSITRGPYFRPETQLVLSAHHFESAPPLAAIKRQLAAMRKQPARVYKMAIRCDDYAGLANLLRVQAEERATGGLALMGMGTLSHESRQLLPRLGSKLVYGYLDEPVAPNQPSVSDLPV